METPESKGEVGDIRALVILGIGFFFGWIASPDRTPKKLLARDGLAYLKQVVKEWRPVNCESEADCQMALQNYLYGRFSEDRLLVESHYGAASSRIDLVVERDYAIEIKYELSEESEVKRLLGQMTEMRKQFKGVLIVACGRIEPELEIRLERDIGNWEGASSRRRLGAGEDQPPLDFIAIPIVRETN